MKPLAGMVISEASPHLCRELECSQLLSGFPDPDRVDLLPMGSSASHTSLPCAACYRLRFKAQLQQSAQGSCNPPVLSSSPRWRAPFYLPRRSPPACGVSLPASAPTTNLAGCVIVPTGYPASGKFSRAKYSFRQTRRVWMPPVWQA